MFKKFIYKERTTSHSIRPESSLDASYTTGFIRHKRKQQLISYLLVAPLFTFIIIIFVIPIMLMLLRSVENPELQKGLPLVSHAITKWDGKALPKAQTFQLLSEDLSNNKRLSDRASAARRLNYEIAGYRTLIMKTARKLKKLTLASNPKIIQQQLFNIDPRWRDITYWHAMKRAVPSYTRYYLLSAIDMKMNDQHKIVLSTPSQRIFINILMRTFWIAFVITTICLLIAFPIAHYMVVASPIMKILTGLSILLPFWTSLLVRTSAWIVVLQKEGIINQFLMKIGLISTPLDLVFNRFGVYITMVHILLPFMVLPIYSVMKGISTSYVQAAMSLGASPFKAFYLIYLPLTKTGIGAGCLLTFIIAVGYYITPSLVGGAKDQMLGYFIAFFTNTRINWGMASSLSVLLLLAILLLYIGLGRFIGISRLVGIKK
ncbi:MAG: ABC transporter permease [Ostreibacterium sp.]